MGMVLGLGITHSNHRCESSLVESYRMDGAKYECSLKSIKRWYNVNRSVPAWHEKEKITVKANDHLTLALKDSSLVITHNKEVIESVALPKLTNLGRVKATVGITRDCMALYIENEHEECRLGLQFLATSDLPSSAVNNCVSFLGYINKSIPVRFEETEPVFNTVSVRAVLQEFTTGKAIHGYFPVDNILPAGLALDEAIHLIIADPTFPDKMAAIHKCVENLVGRSTS